MDKVLTPNAISLRDFMSYKTQKVCPIEGLNIPNIMIPSHLVFRRRIIDADNSISVDIRELFNSLTSDNLAEIKIKIKELVCTKVTNHKMINDIAEEILQNLVISEKNIRNYIQLLNVISPVCIKISETENSQTIGNSFVNKCRDMILNLTDESNIKILAELDKENLDDLDKFTREKDKIINLIIVICVLYEQRSTTNIKLTVKQLAPLILKIMAQYMALDEKMRSIGNPAEIDLDFEAETAYELARSMSIMYAEQLYTFMQREAKDFVLDPTIINGLTMDSIVSRFFKQIVPTIKESYLISNCRLIKY